MLDVHGYISHCWGINVIESSHQGSIKLLASLEQLQM